MLYTILLTLHLFLGFSLIALVLFQQGKSGISAGLGGASQTMFGSRGPASFLFKLTMAFGLLFFSTSIALTRVQARSLVQEHSQWSSLLERTEQLPAQPSKAPAQDAGPAIPTNRSSGTLDKKDDSVR